MATLSRRDFLKHGIVLAAGLSTGCSRLPFRSPDLPLNEEQPDLSDANIVRHVVGLRPYRQKKIRLEAEDAGSKSLVHNYGHGGAGITTSWGTAELAAEMAAERALLSEPVAVLGAGVVGMSTARVLRERGYQVNVYAAGFIPDVTSMVAGGQWAPAGVARGETTWEQGVFDDILARSHRRFSALIGTGRGVSHRLNYVSEEGFGGGLSRVPAGILPPVEYLSRLPFPGFTRRGEVYRTLLIEPPIYLPALMAELRALGVTFTGRRFATLDEVRAMLPERVVVNCLGLGAGAVCNDPLVLPIRGQLVHFKPKPLPYLLIHDGYVFPRQDALVVGGSYEKGRTELAPDPEVARRILEVNRSFFQGRVA